MVSAFKKPPPVKTTLPGMRSTIPMTPMPPMPPMPPVQMMPPPMPPPMQTMQPIIIRAQNLPPTARGGILTNEETAYLSTNYKSKEKQELRKLLKLLNPKTKEPKRLRVLRSQLPLHVKSDMFRQMKANESAKFDEWVETSLRIPFGKYSLMPTVPPIKFLQNAHTLMDETITGHDHVKHEVLQMICTWLRTGSSDGFTLALEGEAGVGKTTFAKHALSRCMNRPFCFIGLGGMSDASFLLGHGYTYDGSTKGRLAECLAQSEVMDPIIFFDELDKVAQTPKGEEVINALIHLTDPVQNEQIRDKYLQFNLDLSKAILIFSYNDPKRINPILLDRIKRVKFGSPSLDEKLAIAKNHLIPKNLKRLQLEHVEVPTDIVEMVIERHAEEPGMRSVERDLIKLLQSYALTKVMGSSTLFEYDEEPKFDLQFATRVLPTAVDDANASHLGMYS